MKTSKVSNVQSEGTWQSPNGLMYKWEVSFENGDHGQAMTKDQEHKTWLVGQEINYELTPNSNPKFLGKLTKVKEPFVAQNNTSFNSGSQIENKGLNVQNLIVAQSSVASACNLLQQSNDGNIENVIAYAEAFYKFVMSKG
jgi:hypothetical protein